MVELWVNFWSGDFFVGQFKTQTAAEEHFNKHKESFRDYRGEKYGFTYGTPTYIELDKHNSKNT